MQPTSDQNQRGLQVPSSRGNITPPSSRDAAVNLMRQQIDQIYDEPQPNEQLAQAAVQPTKQPLSQPSDTTTPDDSTYARNYDESNTTASEQQAAVSKQWQQYHTAWQQYYQMYYERYYQSEVQKQQVKIASDVLDEKAKDAKKVAEETETLTQEQAVSELRNELLNKVKSQTKKIRKSRHFVPAIAALVVAGLFIFLQYNQLIFANVYAFTTPSSTEAVDNSISPNPQAAVSDKPIIQIPKIAVEAPVVYDVNTLEESVIQSKLQEGVVHYPINGANAMPGEIGNTVILGHSANDVFAAGDYKFIFLRLERLVIGDTFYLNYQGKRYAYAVTETKVIHPTEVGQLIINNGKPMATLVSCVPVGTADKRLLVIGEQISPDPSTAKTATHKPTDDQQQNIGGGNKSFFERLFSGVN